MPLYIIRQDITRMQCDAIVNAANSTLLGGGGVDGAIHRAAGEGLLKECKTLGGCATGDAKITHGYNLPCKYVIHTVGPIWRGGKNGEKLLLESCYKKSLALAKAYNCETVAFPIISSGVYLYPKAEAFSVAVDTVSEFLLDNEMTVYIVVYDNSDYLNNQKLFGEVAEYLSDNYIDENSDDYFYDRSEYPTLNKCRYGVDAQAVDYARLPSSDKLLSDMLSHIDDTFAVTLLKLIDLKGMTEVECYKKANVSKQTWYKIMNEKRYKPSKNTVIAFAVALELSLEETKHLLSTVGFALSKSSKFDIIIEYFLIKGEYNILTINETLFKFDQVCLGSQVNE